MVQLAPIIILQNLNSCDIIPHMNAATEKLYDADAYLTTFTAQVLSCVSVDGGYDVVLDRTAFFPEAGGQTPDRGTLGETRIVDVQIDEDGVITHRTKEALKVGAEVSGTVDWKHRFDNMQQHTGEHIVSGLVCSRFGCSNVGFHLGDQTVTMDYDHALTKEELDGIERDANEAIWKNLPVEIAFPDDEELKQIPYRSKKELSGQIRIVTIPGIDICACCAPHVRHTGEIGILKILAAQNYKGGVRVTIACGERAYRALSESHAILTGLARDLSTGAEEVPAQFQKLREELSDVKRRAAELAEAVLTEKLNKISEDIISNDTISNDIKSRDKKQVLLFEPPMDPTSARRALNHWAESHEGCLILLLGEDQAGYQLLIAAGKQDPDADARIPAELLKEKIGIKCGGSKEMVQGRISASRMKIEEALSGS